jgi:hypothetical protein
MKDVGVNKYLAAAFIRPITSKKRLKMWLKVFLGLDFPDSYVDPESNSSPVDWMYDVYSMYKNNKCNESPEVIVISSRESYKTLSEAAFAVLCMIHFNARIAHMAAIVSQATAAQNYIKDFLQKLQPYMNYHKISITSQNDKEVEITDKNGNRTFMKIIVATVAGANSSHTNIFTIDEIDTIRSKEGLRAYKEAQMIPGVFDGQHPVTIKTSTLKFPGGLFMKEWARIKELGYSIHKWNIIDITERCPPERHLPNTPKQVRYIDHNLPLKNYSQEQYDFLTDKEKETFEKIEVTEGCAKCPLLPVCRTRLAKRPETDTGGLWKPIDFTIGQFNKTDVDLAESQLLCRKPSSQGMVYPRFLDSPDGTGNTYTLAQAWEIYTGTKISENQSMQDLIKQMRMNGVPFYCGVDWGSTHAFAIAVTAILPNKEWWLVDSYSVPNLEFDQMMHLAMQVRDTYRPKKWFCDTSQPMFLKAFTRNGMPAPKFTKDVQGGISCVRSQILDSQNNRRLKLIKHHRNEFFLKVFQEHTFKLDSAGNLTQEPDDSDVADLADALRYAAQNLFPYKKRKGSGIELPMPQKMPEVPVEMESPYADWLPNKINELTGGYDATNAKGSCGSIIWDISGDDNE